MAKNKSIQMRLRSVNEIFFSMTSGKLGSEDRGSELQIGFKNDLFPNVEQNTFTIHFGVQYSLNGDVILESVYGFEFEVKNLSEFVSTDEQGKITVEGVLPHMVSVALGTMRGVLAVRTVGTDINKYPIPIMDPIQLCDNLAK